MHILGINVFGPFETEREEFQMKVQSDYRFVRGVNHGIVSDPEILKRDMGFCQKLQLNSTRVWLSMESFHPGFPSWATDKEAYIDRVRTYVRECWKYGVRTMPILWNGNGLSKATYTEEEWARIEEYVKDIVTALKDEEGLLMWDAINEPCCCDWVGEAPDPETKKARMDEIWAFVGRLCSLVKKYDKENALTVGNVIPDYNEFTHDFVDVMTFHTYYESRKLTEEAYQLAAEQSKKYGKPIFQSETGCICRGDAYELELEMCQKYNMGWMIFNLVIQGGWSDVHGLIYPDGTIRDTTTIAALFGLFRKRTEGRIFANPNREGKAYDAIKAVEEVLMSQKAAQHRPVRHTTDEVLDAAELCINLLEAAEMVAMWDAPSARLAIYRATPEENRNPQEIKKFAYDMAMKLKEACLIIESPAGPTWAPDK